MEPLGINDVSSYDDMMDDDMDRAQQLTPPISRKPPTPIATKKRKK